MNIVYKIELLFLKSVRRMYRALHKNPSYNHTTIADDQVSDYIKALLLTDKPCMVGRFGSTEFEALLCAHMGHISILKKYKLFILGYIEQCRRSLELEEKAMSTLFFFSGFFPNDSQYLEPFYRRMILDMKYLDVLGVWLKEDFFASGLKQANFVKLETLEPYDYEHPWSKALEGKKVLVIHPFAKTIEMQYKKRELLFANKDVLPEFELITLKAVQTIAGEQAEFETWFDALAYMERKIDQIDFDVAIIGCGAYGFPLAAYCKKIGKKAIHLGGATQILFGIKGKRWEELPEVAALMNEHWVRPLPEETPQQNKKVEGGCYW